MFKSIRKGWLNCYAMTPLVDQVDLQTPWPCFHGRPLTCSVASILALVNLVGVDNAVVCLGWLIFGPTRGVLFMCPVDPNICVYNLSRYCSSQLQGFFICFPFLKGIPFGCVVCTAFSACQFLFFQRFLR